MKSNTRHDDLLPIDRAVALLQMTVEQGGELPELARLAGATHLSPFHFHRVNRALAGETCARQWRACGLPFRHFLGDPEQALEAMPRADIYLPVKPC